jgi:glycosyltransferase involved in cell wall biosynthesis
MVKPTLHLIGIFHTVHNLDFSHCAFTGKALRFSKMMRAQGYDVIEYANEGSQSAATEKVPMLSTEQYARLLSDKHGGAKFHGESAQVKSPWHQAFEEKLLPALKQRVQRRDIICHPFGHAHASVVSAFPGNIHVETGIGYNELLDGAMKIFESYAWMHYHQGKEKRWGNNYEWVIPNYFDLDDWEPSFAHGKYIAFMGRIGSAKGMDTLLEIAKRVDMPVKVAGQGDMSPWAHRNIEHVGPLKGRERSDFIRNAYCQLMPTNFTEPFGGAGVEGLLCGTPLIARDFGAFAETVQQGFNGFRCHVLRQWLGAIQSVAKLDRQKIAERARAMYSLQACGAQYSIVFQQLDELYDEGWYTLPKIKDGSVALPFRAPLGPVQQSLTIPVVPPQQK